MKRKKRTSPLKTAESPSTSGLSLLELLIAGSVLAIAACGLSSVLVNSMTTRATNTETARARTAARQLFEQIQSVPVKDVYATFNRVSGDDPLGTGTAPGGFFTIETGSSADGSSGMTGEIIFPEDAAGEALREDLEEPSLGMPRDLNGDGVIDGLNHSKDHVVLPVMVRIRWRGVTGERTFEMCGLLLAE